MSDHNDAPSATAAHPQPGAPNAAPWPYAAPAAGSPYPGAWAGPPPWAYPWPHPPHGQGGWHGHPHPGYGYGAPGWAYPPVPAAADPAVGPATGPHHADHHDLLAGMVVGAAAAYLLSNETVQRTLIRGVTSVWSTIQGGIEEVKERFRDAEAELQQAAAPGNGGTGETAQ